MSDCKHPLWERIRLCDEGACPDCLAARLAAAERRAEEAEAEAAAKETTLRVVVSERTRAEARLRECEALIARHINDPAFGDNEIPFDAETMRELRLRALRSPGDHTEAPPCDSCGKPSPDGLHSASGIRLCSTCSPPRSP